MVAVGNNCFCAAGFYGNPPNCTVCPYGTTSQQATSITTYEVCNQCPESNAIYINNGGFNLNQQVCFCKIGYYGNGSVVGSCTKCPNGTTQSNQATSNTKISDCMQCIDANAINNNTNNPACFCKTGYYGDALSAGSCVQCPTSVKTTQENNSNISGCLDQENKSISQNQNVKENENQLYLVLMIPLFFILILTIFIIWFVKKNRSTLQVFQKNIQELQKSQLETLNLIKTYQQEVIGKKQIINQNEIQILQQNDLQDNEEQPPSQQTIQMIYNFNDMEKNLNSDQQCQQALTIDKKVSQ
ncbi:hypothetical protein ABPG74_022491 [Tetrahymena malaccensis]